MCRPLPCSSAGICDWYQWRAARGAALDATNVRDLLLFAARVPTSRGRWRCISSMPVDRTDRHPTTIRWHQRRQPVATRVRPRSGTLVRRTRVPRRAAAVRASVHAGDDVPSWATSDSSVSTGFAAVRHHVDEPCRWLSRRIGPRASSAHGVARPRRSRYRSAQTPAAPGWRNHSHRYGRRRSATGRRSRCPSPSPPARRDRSRQAAGSAVPPDRWEVERVTPLDLAEFEGLIDELVELNEARSHRQVA